MTALSAHCRACNSILHHHDAWDASMLPQLTRRPALPCGAFLYQLPVAGPRVQAQAGAGLIANGLGMLPGSRNEPFDGGRGPSSLHWGIRAWLNARSHTGDRFISRAANVSKPRPIQIELHTPDKNFVPDPPWWANRKPLCTDFNSPQREPSMPSGAAA